MKIDEYNYEKINYQKYQKRLQELLNSDKLKNLGIKKQVLGKTEYNYDIDCLTIGNGKKELFIVGGTHGSEVISVDFILTLIENLPTISNFNPNEFKLIIIPLQNPEGFDISSNTFNQINEEEFKNKSYEYYLRYRTDSIIIYAIRDLNILMNKIKDNKVTPTLFLKLLKEFINTNINWKKLSDERVLPNIKIFNNNINNINNINTYKDIQIELLNACNNTINKLSNEIKDEFLKLFITELKESFANEELWKDISKENQMKLYQNMFKSATFAGLKDKKLIKDIEKIYEKYNHPKGSWIGHDSTGIGINLNANHPLSPGITSTKQGEIIYGPFVKDNIKNYFPGPLGTPAKDVYNFTYAKENQVLEKLIKDSYTSGNYLATILYHGTGGMIFYKPYQNLMTDKKYYEYLEYNEKLAEIYHNSTNYKLLDSSSKTGYGDYLRRTYPGVLLVELSKMGGNPIGPYGDTNNIYNVFHDNIDAINMLIKYFKNKDLIKERIK